MPIPAPRSSSRSRRAGERSRARDVEGPIHRAILDYLRATLPSGFIVHHCANKPRSEQQGAREKRMGAIAGWPDLEIHGRVYEDARPEGYPVVYFLEVKPPGVKTPGYQLDLHDQLRDIGHHVAVVRSIDDVRRCAWNWSLPVADAALQREMTGVDP